MATSDSLRLSPSRINDFNNCPALYKYRAILQLPEPPSIDAERGKMIHTVMERLFEEPRTDRTIDRALAHLENTWRDIQKNNPEVAALVEDEIQWLIHAKALLASYFALENPTVFDSTHREFHLERDFREDVYLHGYVDRIDIAPTGEVRIVDYKTGKSPKPGWEEKALFQLRVYALLYWRNEGVIPKQLKLVYLGNENEITSSPTESVLLSTEKKLNAIADEMLTAIETDHFPTNKTRLCDWCYFKSICPAHQ